MMLVKKKMLVRKIFMHCNSP